MFDGGLGRNAPGRRSAPAGRKEESMRVTRTFWTEPRACDGSAATSYTSASPIAASPSAASRAAFRWSPARAKLAGRFASAVLLGILSLSHPASAQPSLPDPSAPGAGDPAAALVARASQLRADEEFLDALALLVQAQQSVSEGSSVGAELEFELAQTLVGLGLYQSAYTWLERIAEQGDSHPRYNQTIDWFLALQREVPGDVASLERLAEYDPLLYPPAQANEIRFLVGQHFYNRESLDRALESLEAVEEDNKEAYLKAQFLIGVIQTRNNAAQPAVEAFKNILRYERDQGGGEFVESMAKKARLALARVFYTAGQFDTAARYYDQITQDDPEWLDSLFEISWAYFQLGNYERALGDLHTLNSPYFFEEYYPESFVLQSVILLTNCNFRESLRVVEQFNEIYKPLRDELELQLKQTTDPAQFYSYLAKLSKDDEKAVLSKRLKRVFNAALRDRKLRRLLRYVLQIDREKQRIEELSQNAPNPAVRDFLSGLLADVTAYRGLVIGEAGQAAKDRIERVYRELTDLLSQALRVKFETLKAERAMIAKLKRMSAEEAKAQFGVAETPESDEEHVYWPFEGEYWRDELGAYTFLIVNRCMDRAKAAEPKQATPASPSPEPSSDE